jgi:23S rRNA (adenine2030-N6)-methyltransferase
MNYRHAFHAGNFADVLKHAALVSVLQHLKKKEKPFAVIDTHAGRGIYDTTGDDAQKTGEAAEGIGRLLAFSSPPGILSPYLDIVRSFDVGRYPGSPLIAARMLRAKDRLLAVESQTEEYGVLAAELAGISNARVMHGDGYRELLRVLPPAERRAVVLMDPPYEAADEFARAAEVLVAAYQRFATGIYLLWYPAKTLPLVSATAAELLNAGVRSLIRIELDVGVRDLPEREGRGPAMSATGLLAINPPFSFSDQMQAILPFLTDMLARGPGASHRIEVLAQH